MTCDYVTHYITMDGGLASRVLRNYVARFSNIGDNRKIIVLQHKSNLVDLTFFL